MRDRAQSADLPRRLSRRRRCIVPVDGFFEWKAVKGQKAKQPYAIAMKDGRPFGIRGLWENWKELASGEWIRTFTVITTDANELVAEIHGRQIGRGLRTARWRGATGYFGNKGGSRKMAYISVLFGVLSLRHFGWSFYPLARGYRRIRRGEFLLDLRGPPDGEVAAARRCRFLFSDYGWRWRSGGGVMVLARCELSGHFGDDPIATAPL